MSNYNTLKTADTINAISIVDGAITTSKLNASVTTLIVSGSGPKVTAITYPGNDLAADPAGGQTITLTGTGFVSGCSVFVGTTQASVVTVVSATSVTFTAPALAAATYTLYLVNPDGGTATIVPGISYSGTPIWSTTAGSLASIYEYSPISNATTATGDGSISYSVFSGTLPTGSSLNTSTGVITGTSPASAGATTYTFVIRATDAQLQDSDRTFSITVNTDVVTWTTPAAASTVSLNKDLASTTALLATSAANKAITYTATALPAGLSISGATVTGAPTVLGTTAVTFTATAATTGKTATAVINWTVSVAADTYFPYTTLLLSGAATTETFIADASVNNFALTIAGDTKPNNFNPYTPGYYSNYIPTTSDYYYWTDTLSGNFGTGDFTVEGWFYLSASAHNIMNPSTGTSSWGFLTYGSQFYWQENGGNYGGTGYGTVPINQWVHLAVSRTGGYLNLYINGVRVLNSANTFNYSGTPTRYIGPSGSTSGLYWMSNIRFIKGTGIYSGATVTVPTSPLTAIANTSLLTVQSNRMIDNSTNAVVFTQAGSPQIQSFTPFVPDTAYAAYGSTYFDGTVDNLTVATNSVFNFGTGDFTCEAWIYRTASGSDAFIISAGGSGGLFWGIPTNGDLGWGRAGVAWDYQFASGMVINRWYHVALTRSGTSMKMFVNGAQLGVTQNIATSYDISTTALNIGSQGANYYFTGYISNARIVKGVAVYTANFTPPATPLSATQSETSLSTPPTVEYLVVAGGGGAGGSSGGGGGAGGYRTASGFAVAANTAITVTVGAGGSGGAANTKGSAGLNSVFSTITATGGGAGGTGYSGGDMNGGNGGSGGGAGYYGDGTFGTPIGGISSPVTSPVQGYAGGAADPSNNIGGGGGGAGAVGSGGSGTTGAGGIGVQSSITGAATYYAGGGAGWSRNTASLGGLGGGGNESTAGTANTGGGGGAHADYTLGGFAGGSGVVVIRYADTYVAATCTGSPEITIAGGYRIYKFVTSGTMYITFNTETKAAITGSATSLLTCQTNQPANNSMFLDSSTNAFPVTRAGNTSAGTFTPYGANWSNYFDGTGDGLVMPAGLSTAMGAGFAGNIISFEMWIFPTTFTNGGAGEGNGIMGAYAAVSANGRWLVSMERSATTTAKLQMTYTIGTGSSVAVESTASAITLNQWNHIAITVDATTAASSTIKLFANGVLLNTFTGQNMSTQTAYYRPVYVGDVQSQYVAAMVGYISNFRILKGAFAYTGNYTVPTAPLTAIANTVLLTCQSNSLVDNSANVFTISKYGDTSVQRFSPFSPQTQTAITHSVYYGTKTDYISTPATTPLTTFTGDFTFECWVNPTDTSISTNWGIWDSRQSGSTANAMIFTLQNLASPVTGQWRLSYYYGSGTQTYGTGIVLANQWTHVAFVRSGSTLTYYVNGVAGGTATVSGTQTGNATSNPVYIGTKDGSLSGYGTVGYISNFRIVKGVAVYTGNFTVPTAPLTATQSSGTNIAAITGTQTSLLTCQSSTIIDNSTNAYVLTPATTTVKPRTLNPFGFTNTSAGYSAATYGGSAYFDGTGDYLTVPQNAAFGFGTGDFTVEGWYYLTAIVTDQALLMLGTGANGAGPIYCGWWLKYSNAGSLIFYRYDGTETTYSFSTTLVVNTWYHIACSRSGTSLRMFLNGTQIGATASSNLSFNNANSDPLQIGKCITGQGTFYYNGYVNNIRIVKGVAVYTSNFVPPVAPLTAITNTSLLLNMTSSGVYDATSMSNLETVGDAKRVATQTPYAGSYYSNYFDGSGDYLSAPSNAAFQLGTDSYTFEAWIYPTALGVTNTNNIINIGTYTTGLMIRVYGATTGFEIYTNNTQRLATSTGLTANSWQHIALVRNVSACTLYINGQINGTFTDTSSISPATATLIIGMAAHNSGEFFTGYMSNYRLVKGVAVYTGTFTPSSIPLTAIANTSLLTCQSNRFVDNSVNAFAITRAGSTSVQSFNPFQRNSAATLYFDGTGDYLTVPATAQFAFGTGNFTIEAWIYLTAYGSSVAGAQLFGTVNGATSGYSINVGENIDRFRIVSNATGSWADNLVVSVGGGPPLNAWTHMCVVRSGANLTIYKNGVSVATTASAATWNFSGTTGVIGRFSEGTTLKDFPGYINDLRITRGVARYTGTFTPSTSAFITK